VIGTVVTLAGYARKPKATFMLKHPVKSMRVLRARRNLRHTFTPGRLAAGVGVAAAVPLGLWAARKIRNGRAEAEYIEG
jgi:hypothetical protein